MCCGVGGGASADPDEKRNYGETGRMAKKEHTSSRCGQVADATPTGGKFILLLRSSGDNGRKDVGLDGLHVAGCRHGGDVILCH